MLSKNAIAKVFSLAHIQYTISLYARRMIINRLIPYKSSSVASFRQSYVADAGAVLARCCILSDGASSGARVGTVLDFY